VRHVRPVCQTDAVNVEKLKQEPPQDPAFAEWRRGFIRERNQFSKVLEFVWTMDLGDPFLCTIAFPTILEILQVRTANVRAPSNLQ
jgi:hypothetical protein